MTLDNKLFKFIKDNSKLYRSILDNIDIGLYIVDEDRTIVYWSGGAERLTGFKKEEMIGKKCFDSGLNHRNENGEFLCNGFCPLIATMFDGKERTANVTASYLKNNAVPTVVRTFPIYEGHKIIGAYEFFTCEGADTNENR